MENKTYILRKINPNKWSGIRLFDFSNEDIGPAIDHQGLPITGLTEDYFEVNSKGNKELVKGTRVKLEEELGLDPGTLKRGSLIKPSPFWIEFTVRIGEGDLKLREEDPMDRLKILFLKAQPQVADGSKNIKAKSEYVIFTQEEEAVASNKAKKTKREAYTLFDKLSLEDMAEILEVTGNRPDSMSRDVIEDKLSDYMEEYPNQFVAIVKDPTRKNKSFVRKALDKGVLRFEGGAIMYGETVLGYDVDSATAKLFSDELGKSLEAIKLQMNPAKIK